MADEDLKSNLRRMGGTGVMAADRIAELEADNERLTRWLREGDARHGQDVVEVLGRAETAEAMAEPLRQIVLMADSNSLWDTAADRDFGDSRQIAEAKAALRRFDGDAS